MQKIDWALGIAVVLLSIGASWVTAKEQIVRVDTDLSNMRAVVIKNDATLDTLKDVLYSLNATLARMDERMKNVEEGVKELRR